MSNINKKLIKSSASLAALQIIEALIAIIMIPLMIRYLGNKEYGIWVIVLSIVTYLNVINTGITNAVQRYLAIAVGSNSNQKLNEVINSSLVIYASLSIVSLLIVYITANFGNLFIDSGVDLFYAVALIIGTKVTLSIPASVFYALLAANLRQDLQSLIEILMTLIRSGLIVLSLLNNGSVIEIALIVLVIELTAKLFIIISALKTTEKINYSKKYINKRQILDLLRFGSYALIIRLMDSIKSTSHNFLVTKLIGISSVIFISMPFMIIAYLIQFLNLSLSVFNPFLTRLYAAKKKLTIRKNLTIALDISFFISSLMTIGLLIFGDIFIQLVLGDGYEQAKHILQIFSVYILIQGSNIPLYLLFSIYNKQRLLMYASIIEVVLVILFEYFLLKNYGLDYIAWGLIIPSFIIRLVIIPAIVIKRLDKIFITIIKQIIRPIYFYMTIFLFQHLIISNNSIANNWLELIIGTTTIFFLYTIIFYIFLANRHTKYLLKKYFLKIYYKTTKNVFSK